mmetsp:Transcript_29416/g.87303  ORF Transcript_29416/g.87303 Transcript_29416/m.87303 type:complete len:335 (-) Transcript_29416:133-1137(-)
MLDVVLLLLPLRELILLGLRAGLPVRRVVSAPRDEGALLRELHDVRADAVHEVLRVGREQQGVGVLGEVLLQPHAGAQIQVVRRLVEDQQHGLHEEGLREGHAHPPASGHVLGVLVHHRHGEAETVEQLARPGFERVRVHPVELVADDLQEVGVLLRVLLEELHAQLLEAPVLVRHDVNDGLDGAHLLRLRLAIQEPHVDVVGDGNLAGGDGGEHRRLAGAVLADQAVAASEVELQLGVPDELFAVHAHGELLDLDVDSLLLGGQDARDHSRVQDGRALDVPRLDLLLLLELVDHVIDTLLAGCLGLGLGPLLIVLLAAHCVVLRTAGAGKWGQ